MALPAATPLSPHGIAAAAVPSGAAPVTSRPRPEVENEVEKEEEKGRRFQPASQAETASACQAPPGTAGDTTEAPAGDSVEVGQEVWWWGRGRIYSSRNGDTY